MPGKHNPREAQAVHSYLLRVVENRVVTVTQVYELHDITSGACRRFESLQALQRFLARRVTAPGGG